MQYDRETRDTFFNFLGQTVLLKEKSVCRNSHSKAGGNGQPRPGAHLSQVCHFAADFLDIRQTDSLKRQHKRPVVE